MDKLVIWNKENYATYNDALNSGAVYDVPDFDVGATLSDSFNHSKLYDMTNYFCSFTAAIGAPSSGYIMGVEFQRYGVKIFIEINDLIEQLTK